jgi:hypothetical protein
MPSPRASVRTSHLHITLVVNLSQGNDENVWKAENCIEKPYYDGARKQMTNLI